MATRMYIQKPLLHFQRQIARVCTCMHVPLAFQSTSLNSSHSRTQTLVASYRFNHTLNLLMHELTHCRHKHTHCRHCIKSHSLQRHLVHLHTHLRHAMDTKRVICTHTQDAFLLPSSFLCLPFVVYVARVLKLGCAWLPCDWLVMCVSSFIFTLFPSFLCLLSLFCTLPLCTPFSQSGVCEDSRHANAHQERSLKVCLIINRIIILQHSREMHVTLLKGRACKKYVSCRTLRVIDEHATRWQMILT